MKPGRHKATKSTSWLEYSSCSRKELCKAMAHKHYRFPSLNALAAFEAAGRHMSLTRAAAEMNVTPGAVSKHVALLETEIGAKLFIRLHRRLELTAEGALLFNVLRESFAQIAASLDGLRQPDGKRAVSIGSTSAVAQFWLMPRLARFWTAHQDIVVDHMISDRTQDNVISPVDLRIRYGSGRFRDELSAKLFDDRIVAVAAPQFLQARAARSLRDIERLPLLSVEGVDWSWTSWAEFLADAGFVPRHLSIRRFNSYVIATQAAMDGQGVALGWRRLVDPLIAAGRLGILGEHEMAAPQSFYLTWSNATPLTPETVVLRDWLLRHND
jgi:LysR family transcriptional regulator, glycine cleavage system transcriptional activator